MMGALTSRRAQCGAVSVIFVVLFLVIVGYAAITSSTLVSSGLNETAVGDDGVEAELLAQSGLERAFKLLKTGTACSSVGADALQSYGSGTFDITGGVPGSDGCLVTVVARVGKIERTLSGTIKTDFIEPYNYASTTELHSVWSTVALTQTRGSEGLDSNANCGSAVCSGSSGKAFYIMSGTTGTSDSFAGYRQRSMPAVVTGAGGATVSWRLGWKKRYLNTGSNNGTVTNQVLSVSLVDSAGGVVTQLWTNTTISNANAWTLASGTTALPANRTYDRLRVTFNLSATSRAVVEGWVDEIFVQK